MSAEIIQIKKSEQAKWLCSACGSDRFCNCNAPALEKLAAERERQRQKAKAWREKNKENQGTRTGTGVEDTGAEASADARKQQYADAEREPAHRREPEYYEGAPPVTPRERRMDFCVWCDRVIDEIQP